jgi:hypothetical protein
MQFVQSPDAGKIACNGPAHELPFAQTMLVVEPRTVLAVDPARRDEQ